jgi:hypothetical protein
MAEVDRVSLCGALEGETLFSAPYGVYMLTFMQLKTVLKERTETKGNKTVK